MYLFIDTNIYLSFYQFSQDDIAELRKLSTMIKAKKITLLLTDQVRDEYFRNRESKINEAFKYFKDLKTKHDFPRLIHEYPQYKKMKEHLRNYEIEYKSLIDLLISDIKEKKLPADQLIKELFDSSEIIIHEQNQIETAKTRMMIGSPPGKNGSLGDAINWEMLIDYSYASWDDLYFISSDKDYNSCLYENTMNEYLRKEWQDKTSTRIHYYNRLSAFFKDKFPDIQFNENIERQVLVNELCESSSFKETHKSIRDLFGENNFTKDEYVKIFSALIQNQQINQIIDDDDVNKFFASMILAGRKYLSKELLAKTEEYIAVPSGDDFDNIPF